MNKFISFLLETTRYAHFTFDISYFCVSVCFFSIVICYARFTFEISYLCKCCFFLYCDFFKQFEKNYMNVNKALFAFKAF